MEITQSKPNIFIERLRGSLNIGVKILIFLISQNFISYLVNILGSYFFLTGNLFVILNGLGIIASNILVPYLLLKYLFKVDLKGLKYDFSKNKYLIFVILISICFISAIYINNSDTSILIKYYKNIPTILIFYYFCVAVGEEFFFREVIFSLFPKQFNIWLFIIINTSLFVFVHNINPFNFKIYIYGSVFLILLRLLSKNIYAGVLYHFIYDLLIVPHDNSNSLFTNYWEVAHIIMPMMVFVIVVIFLIKTKKIKSTCEDFGVGSHFEIKSFYIILSIFIFSIFIWQFQLFNKVIIKRKEGYTIYLYNYKGYYKKKFKVPQSQFFNFGFRDTTLEYLRVKDLESNSTKYSFINENPKAIGIESTLEMTSNQSRVYSESLSGSEFLVEFETRYGKVQGEVFVKWIMEEEKDDSYR